MHTVSWRNWQFGLAAHVLRAGGIIAYPTEAVWGLGCDPENISAVKRLLALKKRPAEKGLILISGDHEHFNFLTRHLSPDLVPRIAAATDHPTTWLVEDMKGQVDPCVKGSHHEVAVRVSGHEIVAGITRAFGAAIVSTSANVSGAPSARSRFDIQRVFGNQIDFVAPGNLGGFDRPSQIKNLKTGEILRA